MRRFRGASTIPALAIVVLLLVHLGAEDSLSWYQRLIAATPGVAAIYFLSRYLSSGGFNHLPFLEYALVQMYLFWGLPAAVYEKAEGIPVTQTAMTEAVLAVAITVIVVIVSHPLGILLGRAVRPILDRLLPPNPPPVGPFLYLPWIGAGLAAAAGLFGFLPTEVRFAVSVLATYYPLQTYTALRAFGPEGDRMSKCLLGVITALLCLGGLLTGLMEEVIRPLIVSGVLYVVLRRRLPVRWLIAGVVVIVLLQPVKGYYRESAWDEDTRISTDVGLAASRWGEAFSAYWFTSSASYSSNSGSLSSRLNELSPIARTFEMTPTPIGHDHGESWSYLLIAAVPRALMPDKATPTEVFNDRYNLTFGLQDRNTIGSSTNGFPLVADGYWNFGWPGVVLVAAVLGVLLGFFTSTVRLSSWASLTLGVANIAEMRAHTYLMAHLGGLLQRYIGIALACWTIWALARLFRMSGSRFVTRARTMRHA